MGTTELRGEIEDFNYAYADALDCGRLTEWPTYFTEDGFYCIRSRENADAGLPVGLVYCEGMAMLLDRIDALIHTAMFEPRYYRHMISNTRVLGVEGGVIRSESNYMLLETLIDQNTKILQAGKYVDEFVKVDGKLKLKSRDCIYDSLIVQTALIYPV